MRQLTTFSRYLVAVLFIVSGLVKANDPLGLSYKMQEFFEIWNSSLGASSFFAKAPLIALFGYLHEHTLLLSVVMITLEILAGVALIIGWRRMAVLRLLLLLILFFTFLTAYAYGSGKFKNCGCFGDCLPIDPLTSLLKDILLLVLIAGLLAGRKYIRPMLSSRSAALTLTISLLGTLALQWYVLNYLPIVDCLPFKKGNNIAQQMQLPAGARPDSFAIRFLYEKGGKQYEFSADKLPDDLATYTYKDRVDKLVRKGNAEPPIKGFALMGQSGADSTDAVLQLPEAYLLLTGTPAAGAGWLEPFAELAREKTKAGIPVLVASSAPLSQVAASLKKAGINGVNLFALDFTAVRTAARTDPTLYHLKSGTVQEKYSYRQLCQALTESVR